MGEVIRHVTLSNIEYRVHVRLDCAEHRGVSLEYARRVPATSARHTSSPPTHARQGGGYHHVWRGAVPSVLRVHVQVEVAVAQVAEARDARVEWLHARAHILDERVEVI